MQKMSFNKPVTCNASSFARVGYATQPRLGANSMKMLVVTYVSTECVRQEEKWNHEQTCLIAIKNKTLVFEEQLL